jgi:hypothetical protein
LITTAAAEGYDYDYFFAYLDNDLYTTMARSYIENHLTMTLVLDPSEPWFIVTSGHFFENTLPALNQQPG